MSDQAIWVGVARMVLVVPGARTLKDRRQVLSSIRDRLRHRFDVTFHEVGSGSDSGRQTVVVTTAGNDRRLIRSILDQCVGFVLGHPVAQAAEVDVDVFRWHSSRQDWAARMMRELAEQGSAEEEDDG